MSGRTMDAEGRHLYARQVHPSPREMEVLLLVCEGLTNPQIAARLYVSENTVRVHMWRLFARFDLVETSRSGLPAEAFARGIITADDLLKAAANQRRRMEDG